MAISDNLMRLLILDEGYKQFVYDDKTGEKILAPKGTVTFGIGFTDLSFQECKAVLAIKLDRIINQLTNDISYFNSLDEVRQAVLIDMGYNMGVGGLLKFVNMLRYLQKNDYVQAEKEMNASLWVKQVGINRVARLSEMMLSGKWPQGIENVF